MANRINERRKRAKRRRAEDVPLDLVLQRARTRARHLSLGSSFELLEAHVVQQAVASEEDAEASARTTEILDAIRGIVDTEMLQPLSSAGRTRRR